MPYESDGESLQKQFHDFVQSSNREEAGSGEHAEALDGAVLTGWVLVAEWASPDGQPYLAFLSGDATGETPLPVWRSRGLLWYAAGEMAGQADYGETDE